ncbi:MAG: P27 family phage terminase small subunit [Methylophilaceae bacterium]
MSRGPLPKSATVHQLHGNPSKKNLKSVIDTLHPEVEIPGCPPHLLKEAKKEWKRITPILEKYGLISKLDRAALSQYCQQWAVLVYAESQIARAMKRADQLRIAAEEKGEEYLGGDGLVELTKNGNVIYSPYYVIANKSRYTLDRMLANFGMSPAARGRVSPSNRLQADMFGDSEGAGSPSGGFGSL